MQDKSADRRMSKVNEFEIFLACPPGLEPMLYAEVRTHRFKAATEMPGGVRVRGGWPEVWKANLVLRGAGRVTAAIGSFRVTHLTKLEELARRVPWGAILRADVPVRVEASCKQSKIYHSGAAQERIEKAIHASLGAAISEDALVCIRARLENDVCHLAVDTSGEHLHKRGFKQAVNKAPMRETLAALFLRQCGYDGTEPVVDPMCGSGTFVIEAAEIAAGLRPGRSRSFAFEHLATFDPVQWTAMLNSASSPAIEPPAQLPRFYGSDRDAGAITMSSTNADRAGVAHLIEFKHHAMSDLTPPPGPPGLVITNAPFGQRVSNKKSLQPLYRAFGQTLLTRFAGWRLGLITNEPFLATSTGLPFLPTTAPVPHGGLRITLYQTAPLPHVTA